MRSRRGAAQRGTYNKQNAWGHMSDSRRAWVNMPKFEMLLFVGDSEDYQTFTGSEDKYDPEYPPVTINMRFPGRKLATKVYLTGMTVPELEAFQTFINIAVERARKTCEYLDKMAADAFERGDDGYTRLYRPIPRVYDRDGSEPEHDPSVSSGSLGIPRVLADELSFGIAESDADIREDRQLPIGVQGSGVPDDDPQDDGTEDGEP